MGCLLVQVDTREACLVLQHAADPHGAPAHAHGVPAHLHGVPAYGIPPAQGNMERVRMHMRVPTLRVHLRTGAARLAAEPRLADGASSAEALLGVLKLRAGAVAVLVTAASPVRGRVPSETCDRVIVGEQHAGHGLQGVALRGRGTGFFSREHGTRFGAHTFRNFECNRRYTSGDHRRVISHTLTREWEPPTSDCDTHILNHAKA
eukprot:352336-Chlamydomonas_euryale.AAC.3